MKTSEIVYSVGNIFTVNGWQINGFINLKATSKIQIEIFMEGENVVIDFVGVLPVAKIQSSTGFIRPKVTLEVTKIVLGKNEGKMYAERMPLGYPFEYE